MSYEIMSNINLNVNTTIMMSSKDIAELTYKRHDNVRRTIEMLANQGVITLPQIEEKPSEGGRPAKEYIFIGEQGKRDSIIVVAQLSPEFTARIVDRWMELEAANIRPMTTIEMVAQMALKAVEQERMLLSHEGRLDAQQGELNSYKQELDEAKFRIKELLGDQVYFTAMASGKFYGKSYDLQTAQKIGKRLSQLSREMGYEISERASRDYASVGAYHIDVIDHYHEVEQGLQRSKKLENLLYKLAGS